MYCKECGKEIGEAKFCPYCGAKQDIQSTQENQYQQSVPYQSSEVDESHFGFSVLSFFIPIIGIVLYLVWYKDYPKKAKSCLNGLIAGIVLYVVSVCCFFALIFGQINQNNQNRTFNEFWGDSDYNYDYGTFYDTVVQIMPYE